MLISRIVVGLKIAVFVPDCGVIRRLPGFPKCRAKPSNVFAAGLSQVARARTYYLNWKLCSLCSGLLCDTVVHICAECKHFETRRAPWFIQFSCACLRSRRRRHRHPGAGAVCGFSRQHQPTVYSRKPRRRERVDRQRHGAGFGRVYDGHEPRTMRLIDAVRCAHLHPDMSTTSPRTQDVVSAANRIGRETMPAVCIACCAASIPIMSTLVYNPTL